jgi:hypothetical protein
MIAALALLVLLVPSVGLGDQLPLPLEKKITSGTTTISYMGQSLRFTSPVALLVRCDPETTTRFKLTVSIYPGSPQVPGSTPTSDNLNIFWSNYETEVYNGGLPQFEPWTGWLNTEGGFVDR